MALANYTDLQASIAGWCDRDDLTTEIPDFITLAEGTLNSRLRLRVMESDNALTLASAETTVALPDAFGEPVALWIVRATGRDPVRFVPPGQMATQTASGEPTAWTVDGANLAFDRPADSAYSLMFRMLGNFALSDSSPTNWLLTNHPEAYLAASMIEAETFMKNAEEVATWTVRLERAIATIQRKEGRSRKLGTLGVEAHMQPRGTWSGE